MNITPGLNIGADNKRAAEEGERGRERELIIHTRARAGGRANERAGARDFPPK